MKEWMKKHDVLYKLIAVFVSVLLWFVVMSQENPDVTYPFNDLDVEIEGLTQLAENGLAIVDGANSTVDVQITGKRDDMAYVRPDKITVTMSVASITAPGEYNRSYNVRVDVAGVSVTSKSPEQIKLTIDRIVSKSVPVELILTGTPAENYVNDGATLSPDAVVISGPERILSTIDHAEVVYDLSGATESVSTSLTYTLVDADGNEVDTSKLTLEEPSVNLSVVIKQDNEVPLVVNFVSADFITDDMIEYSIDPDSIMITGDPEVVNTINNISLGTINLRNMAETGVWTAELPIVLPNGVTAAEGTPSTAVVTVTVPGYQNGEFVLDGSYFPSADGFEYLDDQLSINLFGSTEEIESLTADSFSMRLVYDPESLVEGENVIPVEITMVSSDNIVVLGSYTVRVNVSEVS